MIDSTTEFWSYFLGFLQADGTIALNKKHGRISFELSMRDADILYLIKAELPIYSSFKSRTRDTNFKKNYTSGCLYISNIELCVEMVQKFGIPIGKKSRLIKPIMNVVEKDYWRGLIDGDGSIGITSSNRPFISLTTDSEPIQEAYIDLIHRLTNRQLLVSRNNRDGVYNIILFDEDAQRLSDFLYQDSSIYISRKYENYLKVKEWVRPSDRKKAINPQKSWTSEEDEIIMSNSIREAAKKLNRTVSSVSNRRTRLKGKLKAEAISQCKDCEDSCVEICLKHYQERVAYNDKLKKEKRND